MKRVMMGIGLAALAFLAIPSAPAQDKKSAIQVDKDKKTVSIDAKISPRKLPHLKGETYPIEVIASWPHPEGRKAHETIVTFDPPIKGQKGSGVLMSDIHKAIESLGVKAGKPTLGESKDKAQGPQVNIYVDVPQPGGSKRLGMDKVLVDSRTGAAFPKNVKFLFTGSKMTQPDPEKDDTVYGADLSGTLAVIFPVSNEIVFQTAYTMKDEKLMRLETNAKNLPPEGTPVKLVIELIAP